MKLEVVTFEKIGSKATPCDLAVTVLAPLDALLHVLDVTEDPR